MSIDDDIWRSQLEDLGAFIRTQRKTANMTLRQLADLTKVSNPYLSQIERGLHEPSVRVLKAVSSALGMSAEAMLAQAGMLDDTDAAPPTDPAPVDVENAITADTRLSPEQQRALITVYRSYLDTN